MARKIEGKKREEQDWIINPEKEEMRTVERFLIKADKLQTRTKEQQFPFFQKINPI